MISNKNNSATVFSVSDGTENRPLPQKDESGSKSADLESDEFISGAVCLDNTGVESSPRGINVSDLLVAENNRNKQEQQSYERNMQQYHPDPIRGSSNQVHGVQAQVISHGMNGSYIGAENVLYGQLNFSSPEVHPAPPSSGFRSPLYVTAASYMTPGDPFYSNLQPSGLFSPQYSVGGYASSSVLFPPYIAGYVPHGAIPMPFNTSSGPRFNVQTPNVSTGKSIPLVGDVQHINKFYGQHRLMLQPSFVDPLYTQYFQLPLESAYGSSGQYGQLASRAVIGGQVDNLVSQSESTLAAYMDAQKIQLPANGSPSIPTTVKQGVTGSSYCGRPPGMGFMTQFPTPPLVSPILPGSPVCRTNHQGRRNELRFSQGSVKNAASYSSWQGLRGAGNSNAPPKHSILEELKTSNVRKFDLSDIAGRIVEFSVDQHGSRFIQQKIEICSVEEKVSIFKEVLPQALKLTTDVFGNYVIQKFFEHGSPRQRKELVDQLAGQILPLSLQMYGCRVIQKALEVIEPDQKAQLVNELDGHVMRCVRDQNGNHVIQKSIECIPTEEIGFIISAFQGQVAMLSTHPYGCRVIQRVLEHCSDEKSRCIVDEILEAAFVLAQDQYGNYVTQHILERGKPRERRTIISMLTGKLVQMSHHKYASNVVEKCLEHGDAVERELLIDEIIGQSDGNDTLLAMMKDQFANYVIQKILEISNDEQKEILLHRISVHLHALNKYTYRKHIVARFEQLCAVKEKE